MPRKELIPVYRKMMLARLAGMCYRDIGETFNHSIDQVRYIVNKKYRQMQKARYSKNPQYKKNLLASSQRYAHLYRNKSYCVWPRNVNTS